MSVENPWKEAVIDALVINHIYSALHEGDPRAALAELIAWENRIALDPAVSAEARALIERGRVQAAPPATGFNRRSTDRPRLAP